MSSVSMSVKVCRRITLVTQTRPVQLVGSLLNTFFNTVGCIAYIDPSRNITESESFLLFRICICQTNGIGRMRMATSVARFREASIM